MITEQEFKKRYDEIKNHPQQMLDRNVAKKRGFPLHGGSKKKFHIISAAILEVYDDLYAELRPSRNEILTIPKAFQMTEPFTKDFEEEESLQYSFDLWRVSKLINLLKTKGTLREKLGKDEEERLYGDFCNCGFEIYGTQYNPFNILNNCLKTVIDTKINEDKIRHLPTISDEQKIRTSHLKKKETAVDWENRFSYEDAVILDRKLTSGKTVLEQYIADRTKILREPIGIVKFKHRMNNLARTAFEDKLKRDPSFSGYEIEYKLSERKLLEALAGESFKELSTYEKTKTRKMLFANRNEELTLFEKTVNGQLKVAYWKLYDYDEYLLPNGNTDIVIKFDISGQDFRDKKNYIYLDNNDFIVVEQKMDEFWKYIETKKDNKDIVKIGKLLKRVKTNKIFQAAPIKFLCFLRLNFQSKHPIVLKKENFSMLCGYIEAEAKSESLSRKTRPSVAKAIVKVVRWMVLWIAKEAGWAHNVKVAEGNVIIIPNHKYFTKWQDSKIFLKHKKEHEIVLSG
jgi:hypothetical protein